jgi:Rho-binding antiterminator
MELGNDDIGRCDFIDVLEEMAKAGKRARVVLSDGTVFVERVLDVVTGDGADFGVFEGHGRVPLKSVTEVTPKYGPETG